MARLSAAQVAERIKKYPGTIALTNLEEDLQEQYNADVRAAHKTQGRSIVCCFGD